MVDPPRTPGAAEGDGDEEALGVPRFLWFDGILEGRLVDPAVVRTHVERINALGHARLGLEILGSRFSILPDSETSPGSVGHRSRREAFVEALEELAIAVESLGEMESTLRCTEVFDEKVRETLFGVRGTRVHPVSGVREITPEDLRHAPCGPVTTLLAGIGRGRLLTIGLLFVVGASFLAWTSGYVDRLFATAVEQLAVETGPFQDMLAVERESAWGNYVIKVRRGVGFPARAEQVEQRTREASDTLTRAAINAVANGAEVYVRLENQEGKVLHFVRIELRALLAKEDAEVMAKLPGMMAGARIRLALDSGKEAGG